MQTRPQRREWQLTTAHFAAFLATLDPDPDQAALRYERLRMRLIVFFTGRSCLFPEDLADEALDRLARRLAEQSPIESIEAYTHGIARLVALEQVAKARREARSHTEYARNISSNMHTQSEWYGAEVSEGRLEIAEESVALLQGYYAGRGLSRILRRRHMAQQMGISMNTLRKRIFDLRASLRRDLKSTQ